MKPRILQTLIENVQPDSIIPIYYYIYQKYDNNLAVTNEILYFQNFTFRMTNCKYKVFPMNKLNYEAIKTP